MYHFETTERIEEHLNSDLIESAIEFTVVSCTNIPADISSPYFRIQDKYVFIHYLPLVDIVFAYPNQESPQTFSTGALSNSGSDSLVGLILLSVLNISTKFQIERKKSFQFFCERKKVTFELLQRKLLFASASLGKGELRLTPLLEKSSFTETVEVLWSTARD